MSYLSDFCMSKDHPVLYEYTGYRGSVVIPDGVRTICRNAFKGCQSITSVVIPEGVITIGYHALDCDALTIHTPAGSVAKTTEDRGRLMRK